MKDRSMAIKHAKARREGLKAAMENENARTASGRYLTRSARMQFLFPAYGNYGYSPYFAEKNSGEVVM